MKRIAPLAATAFAAPALCVTTAQAEVTPLSGKLHISGATAIDPPAKEPKDTHAGFTVEGPAAMRLYRTMKAKANADACLGQGWRSKFAGPMFCSLAPGGRNAMCYLTVSLIDGTTHTSRAWC